MADLIERKAAIDALNEYFVRIGKLKRRGLNKGEKAIRLDTVGAINSLPSAQPEQDDMVDDLISFIESEKDKENRTLADWTVQWILEDIIAGKCKITGSATDHSKKKMYVEFSFYQEEQNEQKN